MPGLAYAMAQHFFNFQSSSVLNSVSCLQPVVSRRLLTLLSSSTDVALCVSAVVAVVVASSFACFGMSSVVRSLAFPWLLGAILLAAWPGSCKFV